eukprot:1066646-Pleurochrysis_carterae.AAC.3
MHEELLVRTRRQFLVQILHEELIGSAVHCRRARRASLITASRDCTLPSGSDRIRVFTRARAVRRASVAGAWRRDGGERRTVA